MNNIYIITGATGAIGKEVAYSLAEEGKELILACRNIEKGEKLKDLFATKLFNHNIYVEHLDLSSFKSVREFASRIKNNYPKIMGLVNNAGLKSHEFKLTEDGFEEGFQVNYLSQVLLTELLIEHIEINGCISFTTSVMSNLFKSKDLNLDINENNFSQLKTYAIGKTCISKYCAYLAEQHPLNYRINCADPGVVDSDMICMNKWYDKLANILFRPFISNPSNGARAVERAIVSRRSGRLFPQVKSSSKLDFIMEPEILQKTKEFINL